MADTMTALPPVNTPAPAAAEKGSLLKMILGSVDDAPPPQPPENKPGKDLYQVLDKPEPATKPEDKTPEPKDEPAPSKPADTPPPKVDKKRAQFSKETPIPPALKIEPKETPPPALPSKEQEDDAQWEANLLDEEKFILDRAKFADGKFQDLKGIYEKTRQFLKEAQKRSDAPDFDENAAEYQEWVEKNRPKITPIQMERIREAQLEDRYEGKLSKTREEYDHELFKRDQEPVVQRKVGDAYFKMAHSVLPEDLMKAIQTDAKKAQRDFSLEYGIANRITDAAQKDIDMLYRLTAFHPKTNKPLMPFDHKNEQHQRLLALVTDIDNWFEAKGGAELMRDGKRFVTRTQWAQIPTDQRNRYWKFTEDELVHHMLGSVKATIAATIDQEIKSRESQGFKRVPASAVPPTPPPTAPGSPPAPRPSSMPNANGARPSANGSLVSMFLGTPER